MIHPPMRTLLLLIPISCVLLAGCAPRSTLRLEQPRLSSPEANLDLSSAQVYWSEHDGIHRVLGEIPLPGADTGRPTYLIYLRMRFSKGKSVQATDVRGFLIQTRGPRKGLTPLSTAGVTAEPPAGSAKGTWVLHAQLVFEDHSSMTADLNARREDWKLLQFETRTHAADVRALDDHPPQP